MLSSRFNLLCGTTVFVLMISISAFPQVLAQGSILQNNVTDNMIMDTLSGTMAGANETAGGEEEHMRVFLVVCVPDAPALQTLEDVATYCEFNRIA